MPINMPKQSGGVMGSTAGKVGLGFATGGPLGAGLALLSSGNKDAGQLGSMARMLSKGAAPAEAAQESMVDTSAPAPNAIPENPMERRMMVAQQDPNAAIHQGLEALKAAPPEMQAAYAPALLQAKHFGRSIG